MIRRLGWIGIGGIALLGAACGGTVLGSDGKGTPSDDLHTNGAERCKAACAKIVSCGGTGSQSCDCSCPPCPVGATSCDCPPCACTREAQAPAKCESDCNDAVQQVLAQTPDCGAPMLALLGCLAAAPCQVAGAEPCKAEQDARQICDDAHHGNTPPRGDPVQDPGASGGPGISPGPGSSAGNVGPAAPGVGVTCTSGFAGSADGSSGTRRTRLPARVGQLLGLPQLRHRLHRHRSINPFDMYLLGQRPGRVILSGRPLSGSTGRRQCVLRLAPAVMQVDAARE
jgi:hypothetical protein